MFTRLYLTLVLLVAIVNVVPYPAQADMTAAQIHESCVSRDRANAALIAEVVFAGGGEQVSEAGLTHFTSMPTQIVIVAEGNSFALGGPVELHQALMREIMNVSNGVNRTYAAVFPDDSIDIVIAISGSTPICHRYKL